MPLDALILDVDGTLVDTNPIHAQTFAACFQQFGYVVGLDRIAPEIGKGGDHLIPDVLGRSADQKDGQNIRETYRKQFLDTLAHQKVALLPGALEIIEAAKKRGLKVAIATSGEKEFLEAIERSCGVAFSELADLVITASDAKASKPSPDILSAATQKLGLTPAQCALVGDTPHDARACRAAGVVCLGVESGGHGAADLREAGCRRVYADCAEIAANFEEVLQIAAPVRVRLTQDVLEKLMREALQTARDGMEAGEAPIGSVLANGDAQIIARGWNSMNATQNKTAHAEMVTFAHAAGKTALEAHDLILVSSLEPCVMCLGAAMEAGVDVVVYALEAPFDGGTHRVSAPRSPESLMPRIVGPILESESRALFEEWLEKNRDSEQAAFIKQLLGEE